MVFNQQSTTWSKSGSFLFIWHMSAHTSVKVCLNLVLLIWSISVPVWLLVPYCYLTCPISANSSLTTKMIIKSSKGPSINVNIFMSVQTIHFLTPPPPKRVHINISWVPKIPIKIIKIRPKRWKCIKKMLIFTDPPLPESVCMVCTCVKMLTFMDGPSNNGVFTVTSDMLNWVGRKRNNYIFLNNSMLCQLIMVE